jgi:hypothetical protein
MIIEVALGVVLGVVILAVLVFAIHVWNAIGH